MPSFTQLEYIVKVAELRHFGKAAEACHVSQPSLSMQIQKVEDEIGFILFDRIKKPIVPTSKGLLFIEQAKIILREQHKLMDLAKKSENEISGEFSLGIIPTLAPYVLPLFLKDFSEKYPKVNLKINELKTNEIIDYLNQDKLDAGILATPLGESGLIEQVLFYENFLVYVSQEHQLSKRKKIKEEELDGSELWLMEDGHCLRNQVVRVCSLNRKNKGVYRNIQFESGNLETLCHLVKSGRGYTLVPQLFVEQLGHNETQKYIREFENPAPAREVSLVYRREQWKADILGGMALTILDSLPKSVQKSFERKKIQVIKL
ncbi:MAG: LysR family transcriptional regulator [Bacteriovoracaceae bacterium]|nr:LysR family transcriptional regulator [Bacteriovoracaceae bacterium]